MVVSIGSRGSHIPGMTPRRKRLGVIAGMWDPFDPIETTMTLIAVNISVLLHRANKVWGYIGKFRVWRLWTIVCKRPRLTEFSFSLNRWNSSCASSVSDVTNTHSVFHTHIHTHPRLKVVKVRVCVCVCVCVCKWLFVCLFVGMHVRLCVQSLPAIIVSASYMELFIRLFKRMQIYV